MSPLVKQLEAAALQLSSTDRADLALSLLRSLEAKSTQEHERIWTDEAQRRWQEIEEAEVETRDFDAVLAEIRATLP
jgi:Putative addiction module component